MDEQSLERLKDAEQLMDGACAILAALRDSGACEVVSVLAVLNLAMEAVRDVLWEALKASKQAETQTGQSDCR